MWIQSTSQISDNIFQVTTSVSSHLLICGAEKCGLVDASIAGGEVTQAVENILKGRELDYIFLTHCDADHIGGIYELRQKYPNLVVVGAAQSEQVLSDTSILKEAYARNKAIVESFKGMAMPTFAKWGLAIKIDKVLEEGGVIELGAGVNIKCFSFIGHTKEQLGYYVPSDKALAAGEAFGYFGGRDKEVPSFRFFNDYISSLNKAAKLEINILSFPHNGLITGEMIARFLHKQITLAQDFRNQVKEQIDEGKTIDEIYATTLADWRSLNYAPDGPFIVEQCKILREMLDACNF